MQVKSKYHVSFDSRSGNAFIVANPDGKAFKFHESKDGLYFLDTEKMAQLGSTLVNTVADDKPRYTNDDCSKAILAIKIQIKIGGPSTKEFIRIITSNLVPNCPLTKADVLAAKEILGPDMLKGKTTRHRPHAVKHSVEPLCIDMMFINKVALLVTLSQDIRFGTVEAIPNWNSRAMVKGVRAVVKLYRHAGFQVTLALMDGQISPVRGELAEEGLTRNKASWN